MFKRSNLSSKIATVLLALWMPVAAQAVVDCGPYEIVAIQTQATNQVLIRVGIGQTEAWRNLGLYTTEITKSYQSLVQQAMASDTTVVIRYPDGNDCFATDYTTLPIMVRLLK